MMKQDSTDTILIRYAEIGLKGKNRIEFERCLIKNINDFCDLKVERRWGYLVIHTSQRLVGIKDIFGVSSISFAKEAEPDIESIKVASDVFEVKGKFRVSANRSDKNLKFSSMDVERQLGAYLVEKGGKVSLKEFDTEVGVMIANKAYVFTEKIRGVGGLPMGVEGRVLCIIDDKESIFSAWMMMKRGCDIVLYSKEDVDISFLKRYYHKSELSLHRIDAPIEELMRKEHCKAIVSSKIFETKELLLTPTIGIDSLEDAMDNL